MSKGASCELKSWQCQHCQFLNLGGNFHHLGAKMTCRASPACALWRISARWSKKTNLLSITGLLLFLIFSDCKKLRRPHDLRRLRHPFTPQTNHVVFSIDVAFSILRSFF